MISKPLGAAFAAAAVLTFGTPQIADAEEPYFYTAEAAAPAVGGYDPITFFDDGEGERGNEQYSTTYKGANFHFVSRENRETFDANPEAYVPQFGGYCAWAIGQDSLAPGNPENANVIDGKLYLNVNDRIERRWLRDTAGHIERAEKNWPGILG